MPDYKLVYQPTAKEDIQATLGYYDDNGLTAWRDWFLDLLAATEGHILAAPQHFSFYGKEPLLRFARIGKLPFNIFFEIVDDTIFIYAVRHTSRDSFI